MATKFFRKNASVKAGALVRKLLRLRLAMTALLLWPMVLAAQNGITVSNLIMDAGTVTFSVNWKNTGMPAIWSDTAWVWVDYNTAGTMTRLPLAPGATLTATSAPGVAKVMEVSGNNKGVWVVGNARDAGSFSATVRLLTATATAAAACVYASNYPPVGQYTTGTNISFRGTRPYDVVLKHTDGSTTVTQVTGGSYSMPAGYTLQSFTDKTGAPGVLKCTSAALPTVTSSTGGSRCGAGTVTLMASSSGAVIDWYSAASGETLLLSGNNTYTTSSISTSTTYYAQARNSSSGCLSAARTAVLATINSSPAVPTMSGGGTQCGGSRTIKATAGSGGTGIRWTDNNSTSASRTVSTTGTYYAVTTSAACGESSSNGVSVTIASTPSAPSLSVSPSTACVGTTVTFTASGCSGSGCDWTGSFSGTGTTKTTSTAGNYSAQVRSVSSGCYSSYSASRSATITAPATSGNTVNACGCAGGLSNCQGTCKANSEPVYDATCYTNAMSWGNVDQSMWGVYMNACPAYAACQGAARYQARLVQNGGIIFCYYCY